MHSAPALVFPVGRSRLHGLLAMAAVGISALAVLAWTLQTAELGLRHLGTVLLWLVSAAWALTQWWRTPQGCLAWDGTAWNWTCADRVQPVTPEVTIDLQGAMLLRLHISQSHGHAWIWPERRSDAKRWLAFRRAVFGQLPAAAAGTTAAELPDADSKAVL